MHAKLTPLALVASLLLALASACGDDNDAPEFQSGLADNRTIAELNPNEVQTFCQSLGSWAQDLFAGIDVKRVGCTFLGIAFSSVGGSPSKASCEQGRDQCIQMDQVNGDETVDFDANVDCSIDEITTANCMATVGEIESCLEETGRLFRSLADRISCDIAGDQEQLQSISEDFQNNPCASLQAKCPGLNGD